MRTPELVEWPTSAVQTVVAVGTAGVVAAVQLKPNSLLNQTFRLEKMHTEQVN